MKVIFHWKVQSLIFFKSFFNSTADAFTSCTIKNREVSLASHLAFDNKPSDKSLIYNKKGRGSTIDPPSLALVSEENWPLSVILYFLFLTTSDKIFSKSFEIQFYLSLNIIPSCQTLSKALYISKKTLLTSNPSSKMNKFHQ